MIEIELKKIYIAGINLYRSILTKLFSVFKVNSKRIYVSSFFGRYSDSPKVLALALANSHKELEVVYQINKNHEDLPKCLKSSTKGSIRDIFYRTTARVIIDNNYGGNAVWLKDTSEKSYKSFEKKIKAIKKRKQTVVSTWHGTPLKKMGIDAADSNIIDFDCPNTIFALGNRWTADVMRRLTFNRIPISITGLPRNDVLINTDRILADNIKRKMGIDTSKKVLLYAPTFREANGEGSSADIANSGINQINEVDFDKLAQVLASRFGGDWVFVLRFHHYVEKKIAWESITKKYRGKVINGNLFEDMADYLQISDVLITDASSSFFDFALTSKPCFLFFPDVERYSRERGLYFQFSEIPFPMSRNFEELMKTISDFNEDTYKIECADFLKRIGNADDGHSTQRIISLIDDNLMEKWV